MSDHFNSANVAYPSATEIGREFVRYYYTKWSFNLSDVYHFYGSEAVLSYDGLEASGQEDIQKAVNSLGYHNCKARIHSVNGLYGMNDSLTLQVCGELSFNGGVPRKFFQSFVLCKQSTKKYYVQTDIFQWVDKAFCAELAAKKPAVAAIPSESVQYAPQPPAAAVEKSVMETSPTIDHHTYVEPQQPLRQTQQQAIVKDISSSGVETVVKPQQTNGHDGADVTTAKQSTQQVNGYVKPETARHSASNVSGVGAGGNTTTDVNANVHHQPQQSPVKPVDNHPKSWAKAVSNNTSSGAPPPQQPPQPAYNADSVTIDVSANHNEENAGAKRGHPRHYEKRNSGEFRGVHYNNSGGGNNYRYQNRDGGPRDGYQSHDSGASLFRGGRDNRDGSNRNSYGGERRHGGPGGGGGNRNYVPHGQHSHQGGPPVGGRFGPSGGGNRHAFGGPRLGGGGHRNYPPLSQHNVSQPQNIKAAQE